MPNANDVPMMFRAQLQERCKLENPDNKAQRDQWIKEWVDPQNNNQPYIYIQNRERDGLNGNIYRIFVKFNFRVLTNSGQDSIIRPILGKNGIPFIPGSSIKGLFLRVCDNINKCYNSVNNKEQITQKEYYCGSQEHSAKVRFLGAYPVGKWTGQHNVNINQHSTETRYSIVDLVHPQQDKQVKFNDSTTSAYLAISLAQPTLMFQFSTVDPNLNWDEFKTLFNQALSQGLGGKTSVGYGFVERKLPNFIQENEHIVVSLTGEGVASVTLNKDPEFRPQTFKASLRGHVTRLLGGVSQDQELVNSKIEQLFGYTDAQSLLKLFWQEIRYTKPNDISKNIYTTSGKLYLYAPQSELILIKKVLQFAYIMAGFGKTWRRVSHHEFYKSYVNDPRKFQIGCHWTCPDPNFINITTTDDLKAFLNDLVTTCQQYLGVTNSPPNYINNWRESWHQHNVKVFAKVVTTSQVITLFHENRFKFTPAIGGRNSNTPPQYVSHVWHRMLPIGNNQYLEIVTIFKGNDPLLWNGNKAIFETELTNRGLTKIWG